MGTGHPAPKKVTTSAGAARLDGRLLRHVLGRRVGIAQSVVPPLERVQRLRSNEAVDRAGIAPGVLQHQLLARDGMTIVSPSGGGSEIGSAQHVWSPLGAAAPL